MSKHPSGSPDSHISHCKLISGQWVFNTSLFTGQSSWLCPAAARWVCGGQINELRCYEARNNAARERAQLYHRTAPALKSQQTQHFLCMTATPVPDPHPRHLLGSLHRAACACVVLTSPPRSHEQCLLGRTQALDGTLAINVILVFTLYSTEGKLEGTGGGIDAAGPLISPQTFLSRKLGYLAMKKQEGRDRAAARRYGDPKTGCIATAPEPCGKAADIPCTHEMDLLS